MVKIYRTKTRKLAGTDYKEIRHKALASYDVIRKRSKRRPYVRSAYFNKEKIFLGIFWSHLYEKNYRDQRRRMKLFNCAIELIQKSKLDPISRENPNRSEELLHKFFGISPDEELFIVQIKENKRNNQKWLISIFRFNGKFVWLFSP